MELVKNVPTTQRTEEPGDGHWFMTVVDVGCGVNSYILYQSYKDVNKLSRIQYLKSLANSLTHSPHGSQYKEFAT